MFREQPSFVKACRRRVPLGRLIEPDEVAEEVLHLASPRNRNITGATILLDGGLSLGPLANQP
jgi:NAD(P)-dependent dehydrogenase (short-subunit alcohol dehydrogenase family)